MATVNHNQHKNRSQNDNSGCSSAQTHLHAYLEGELDPIRTALLTEHMEGCCVCREQAEELKLERIWLLESCVDSPALPDSFAQKVMLRVKEEKNAQARRARRGLYLPLGAAAAVVVVSVLAVLKNPQEKAPGKELGGTAVARVEPKIEARESSGVHRVIPDRDLRIPRRITRLTPHSGQLQRRIPATTLANFGHVLGMAEARLSHARDRDPCEPDPNQDGKTDWNDVAYSFQVILSGQPPSPLDVSEPTLPDPDCENVCRA